MGKLSNEVSKFLDDLNHPFRNEIENLRHIIISANEKLSENIKWNSPNYHYEENDIITMRINPPRQIQVIFHRGAKKKEKLKERMINDSLSFLDWKENDRAVATFKNLNDIEKSENNLILIIKDWIRVNEK